MVDHDEAGSQHVAEPVLAHQHDQCGRGADDRLRAQAGTLALNFSFQSDQRGQAERDHEFDDLSRALPGPAEKGRICQPLHEGQTNALR